MGARAHCAHAIALRSQAARRPMSSRYDGNAIALNGMVGGPRTAIRGRTREAMDGAPRLRYRRSEVARTHPVLHANPLGGGPREDLPDCAEESRVVLDLRPHPPEPREALC